MANQIAKSYWENKILKWEKFRYTSLFQFSPFSWSVRSRLFQSLNSLNQRLKPGMRVVELGCASGVLAELLKVKDIHYLGIDIASNAISEAQNKLRGKNNFTFQQNDILDCELTEAEITFFLGVTDWLSYEDLLCLLKKIKSPEIFFSYTSTQEVTAWSPYRYYRKLIDKKKSESTYAARTYTDEEIKILLEASGFKMNQWSAPTWANPGGPGLGAAMTAYFDKNASEYHRKSQRGLWSKIRSVEKAVVMELLQPVAHEKIMDLGCGAGFYARALASEYHTNVLAVDRSQAMLDEISKEGISTLLASVEEVKSSLEFNAVVMAGVLEFVEKPEKAFASVAEFLKPHSRLVILVPQRGIWGLFYSFFHKIRGNTMHVRSKDQYIQWATLNRFQLLKTQKCLFVSTVLLFRKI